MKFTAIALAALASVAVALPDGNHGHPSPPPKGCKPATYSCLPYANGWQVCNTSGQWVFAGDCPPKTICKFDNENGSPYCVPPGFPIPPQ